MSNFPRCNLNIGDDLDLSEEIVYVLYLAIKLFVLPIYRLVYTFIFWVEGFYVVHLITVSIAKRLQDPLAELVKIEPRHIGVGMYQVCLLKEN